MTSSKIDEIQEEKSARTFAEIRKFNPYHDHLGRFSSGHGAASFTVRTKDPAKQHWADMAIARMKDQSGQQNKTSINAKQITHEEALNMRKQMGQDRDSLTDEEYSAIKGYVGNGNSFAINTTLRNFDGDISVLSPKDQKTVETIEAKCKPAPMDMKVVRKCSSKELQDKLGLDPMDLTEKRSQSELDKMVGKVKVKDDLMSTGYSIDNNCFVGRPVTLNLNVPKGKKMMFAPDTDIAYDEKTGKWVDCVAESEVVFPRKTAYKITRVRQEWNDEMSFYETIADVDILLD